MIEHVVHACAQQRNIGSRRSRTGRLLFLLAVLWCAMLCSGQTRSEVEAQEPNAPSQSSTDPYFTPELRSRVSRGTSDTTRSARSSDELTSRDRFGAPEQLSEEEDSDLPLSAQEADAVRRTPLSAERIIAILQEQPELLKAMKRMLARRMGQQRSFNQEPQAQVDENNITDDALFSRIEQDSDLRIAVTQEIRNRGLGDDDLENDGASSRLPQRNPATPGATLRNPRARRDTRRPQEEEAADGPKMVRRPSPYPTLPSLKDLYAQYPSLEVKVKRFGNDIFQYGTGNADQVPMDMPAGPDYVVGPGDGITLNIWGSISQRLTRTIDRQGQIALPEAGPLTIAGMTIGQAQDAIQKVLNTQFKNVRAEISLARLRSVRIYVVGDVQRPGAYDISALSTPLNALYAAGGPTARGSLRTVRHYRGKQLVRDVDLYDFILRGTGAEVDHLQSGDTIMVPPIGTQVTVTGMVRRPAIYEVKGEQCLGDLLELAGGVLVSANMRQITVERVEAHQRRTMLSLQLPADGGKEATATALAGFKVQDGDRVVILPILPYNEGAVYLQGHVFRPGKYSYHDRMTVNELLRSYQDVLPEPADHAEIIRLQPPDFRPSTISFTLSEILGGDDPIDLQPFDVVRVFSRYEIDAPKVTVYGEVLRPGEYPLAQGMTAAGLVQMAGGFKRSAFRQQADVTSYVVQNGEKVLTKHTVIDIAKALDGDKGADITLKPGDVVSIHQLTGWKDIGAAVTIKGEVQFPGSYGIQEGERLSSVLKRAGGFRPTAYATGAVLERVQVRDMAEKSRLELIRRLESALPNPKAGAATPTEQMAMLQAMQVQQQQVLGALRSNRANGRMVIRISADIAKWENTPADIELRAGDVLSVPKKPDFVLVSGQVYNSSAMSFVPGKTAGWYLERAGGPTQSADRKSVFVVRADGSVVSGSAGGGWWKGNVLSVRLQPGDSVVVPDKVVGGSMFWRNLVSTAQLASSVAITAGMLANF